MINRLERGRVFFSLFLTLFLVTFLGRASEVIKVGRDPRLIAVSHLPQREWTLDDFVCVFYREKETACGWVIKTGARGSIVELSTQQGTVTEGDAVRASEPKTEKTFSRINATAEIFEWLHVSHKFNLSAGVNTIYPLLHFQLAVSKHFALGLMPNFYEISVDRIQTASYGTNLSIGYFLWIPYRGPWIQVAGGAYSSAVILPSGTEAKVTSTSFLSTLGWRWPIGRHANMGFGAGAQASLYQKSESPGFSILVWTPAILVDAGISF